MASEEVIYDTILCDQCFSLLKNVVVKGTETSYRALWAGCSAGRLRQHKCHTIATFHGTQVGLALPTTPSLFMVIPAALAV